ncbi:hypothetical protein [Curtobacterium sp. PhB115]|uniref:hypothetical protein n=1 Tax=Curtobacterium sp. PhB115 TaxID=2485173 RepID=UPI000F4B8E59|nr:hypothetical protein [Curtobacterium sp. PhB115]ROP60567.1 hypothetical protein EDF19_3451 [Curtobacterium sp. PhB115]
MAILVLVDPVCSQATVAFWWPTIGIAIQDRERAARARLDRGLQVDRRSLLSPPWLEPTCAVLLTSGAPLSSSVSWRTWGNGAADSRAL